MSDRPIVPTRSGKGQVEAAAGLRPLDSFIDRFDQAVAPGRVIGSEAAGGVVRTGIDREGIIGIDHGALRIQPLIKHGWGRAGIAYGPYARRNGLAFGTFLLNGHIVSRAESFPDGFKMRLGRWLAGSEVEKPLSRLFRFARSPQKRFMWRRLRQWIRGSTRFFRVPVLDENLAVGWFPSEAPVDPLQQGNGIIVHSIVAEGGELWARTGSGMLRTAGGLQNVPFYMVVVLRENGAAYYAASLAGVPGLPAWPVLRLLAIDPFTSDPAVYAGIHQSVLGEIGFRVDTRVYRTQIATLPGYANWYGSAHGADQLTGDGPLSLSPAETGGSWHVIEGGLHRTGKGAVGAGPSNTALLQGESPAGLVHLLIETADLPVEGVGIVWRAQDRDNFWCFEAGSHHCRLSIKEGGRWFRFPMEKGRHLLPGRVNALQVVDDGENIRLHLNGDLVYGSTFSDTRLHDAAGAGIYAAGSEGAAWLRSFEVHPREIAIPLDFSMDESGLQDGGRIVLSDNFEGAAGDLAGHALTCGPGEWRKEIGKGVIELTGNGSAKVLGSPERPCPGRTGYTVDWPNPGFADVQVRITPPARRQGVKERGRGGLIFWQDSQNYITLNLWHNEGDVFSLSSFFCYQGFEELYDAVWTNIGSRIQPGVPYDLRVLVDGKRYLVSINGEPVLYRALTDVYPDWENFLLRRIGIVANWEWGNDTGSIFQNFVARDRA